MGLIPALSSLFFAALWLIPIRSPISFASKPLGILIISDYTIKKLENIAEVRQYNTSGCVSPLRRSAFGLPRPNPSGYKEKEPPEGPITPSGGF
jgi:hypothetical protein